MVKCQHLLFYFQGCPSFLLGFIFIELYLTIKNNVAIGLYQGDKYGQGRGQMIVVSGPYLIFFGLIFMIFPIYVLTKKYLKNKRD